MTQLNSWRLEPKTAKDADDCQTPQGMRRRLRQAYYHDPLVRCVYDMGEANGLHELDILTILAFMALVERERLVLLNMETLMHSTKTMFPTKPMLPTGGEYGAH